MRHCGFNSTMVRLKVGYLLFCESGNSCFNSTMVRLKADTLNPNRCHAPTFQFHNGSIRRRTITQHLQSLVNSFNSTMVRLKVSDSIATVIVDKQFQFHNGSIKRERRDVSNTNQKCFNSTMVRLKVASCKLNFVLYCRFNSTMVRLKVANEQGEVSIVCRFNSTMVRLKVFDLYLLFDRATMFQFHNGSIKRCDFGKER